MFLFQIHAPAVHAGPVHHAARQIMLVVMNAKVKVLTLLTTNFGRFTFLAKFCPKSKTSEIFCVRHLKAFKIFRDLFVFQKYFLGSYWMTTFLIRLGAPLKIFPK